MSSYASATSIVQNICQCTSPPSLPPSLLHSQEDLAADDDKKKKKKKTKRKKEQNINVRAAFIHVIGDLFQSVGVVIAGYIIWFKVRCDVM